MLGYDANYVPGWDCHGLPIEWKIEEEYRAKGKNKDAVPIDRIPPASAAPSPQHWIDVQREEFKRLGVDGDWDHPYTTMDFAAEAQIARELMKFAQNGTLYRGSKPVMWSVVEKTALAEAEVEYEDYVSDQVWVKFPVRMSAGRHDAETIAKLASGASIVIWTTTPWTIPGNRAISFSPKIDYGLYEVTDAPGGQLGEARRSASCSPTSSPSTSCSRRASRHSSNWTSVPADDLAVITCAHPLKGFGGGLRLSRSRCSPATTSPTTPAPASSTPRPATAARTSTSGRRMPRKLAARGINTTIPYTVDATARFTAHAPGFTGKRVLTDKGEKGDANEAVIKALIDAGMLLARGRLKHQYPHSWRSKKPVIFRNTPQWFIAMDKPIADAERPGAGRRHAARTARSTAIKATRWVPAAGREPHHRHDREQARLGDLAPARLGRADHRVRAREATTARSRSSTTRASTSASPTPSSRKAPTPGTRPAPRARFLGPTTIPTSGSKVDDILDVWFDSGSHPRLRAGRPASDFPGLAGISASGRRRRHRVYLEGSDQHRGWFQSSLLECCGTRGRAPFDVVLTHGFMLDEHGAQDVEVARQRHRAAGRDQAVRRRHPAAVGLRIRLCRRPAHRPGNPQDHGRDLPQAAQHDALDAGLARAFPRRGPHRAGARCRSSSG